MNRSMRACATGAFVAVLSACGGGGGGESGGDPADQAALGTPEKVVTRLAVGSLAAFFAPAPAAKRMAGGDEIPDPEPRRLAKAVSGCENGGTMDRSEPFEGDMDSPYSADTFLIEDTEYDACTYVFDDGEVLVQDGFERFGCPLNDSAQGYPCSDGTNPMIYAYEVGTPAAPAEQTSTFTSASGAEFELSYQYTGTHSDTRTLRNADGITGRTRTNTSVHAPSQGTVRVNGGAPRSFTRSSGRANAPLQRMRVREPGSATLLTIDGYNSFVGTGCNLGEYHLRTVLPLQYTENADLRVVDVLSGKVEITQDGKVATAEITPDGSLLVTDGDGDTATYTSVEQVRALLGGCLDFAAN